MVKILYETWKTNSETIPQVKKHLEEILNSLHQNDQDSETLQRNSFSNSFQKSNK
jgi:hypothetical protein